jgi:hypothetical protein
MESKSSDLDGNGDEVQIFRFGRKRGWSPNLQIWTGTGRESKSSDLDGNEDGVQIFRFGRERGANVGWTERSEVQQPVGINVGLRCAQSNLRGLSPTYAGSSIII